MLWRVYKHTGNVEDYTNYKEALNLATTEIRKSKRTYEKKLAGNIKNDSKSFYAYVRSKQKVRDIVGPLENNSENIISDGFQMAEVLNEYFSSVFTTEDISSLPFPFTKFEGNKSEQLGQLFVTPEMMEKKGSRNKPENYRPVSLTSVVCKLLKTLIRDHMVEFLVKHKLINTSQYGFLKV